MKDGKVLLNADQTLAGRSAYLCGTGKCLEKAKNRRGKNGLEFVLKAKIPDQIWADLKKIIKQA